MTTSTPLDRDELGQLLSYIDGLEVDDDYDDGYDYGEVVTVDHYTADEVNEPISVEVVCYAERGDGVCCARLRNHVGDHAGYGFSIRNPETWTGETP